MEMFTIKLFKMIILKLTCHQDWVDFDFVVDKRSDFDKSLDLLFD